MPEIPFVLFLIHNFMLIDGKKIAAEIIEGLKKEPRPKKFLAAILVGEDLESAGFLNRKGKIAKELGIDFRLYRFPADIKQDPLRKEVLKIASHKTCGGVVVQLHLPDHINNHYILNVIPREKDLDVLSERALGAFYVGRNPVLPPAVGVVEKLIRNFPFEVGAPRAQKLEIENCSVAVLGLGILVGKPIANWLMRRARNLFLLRKGSDFSILKNADIVISGVGKPKLFGPADLKENAFVIDFGYSRDENGKLSGDFDASGMQDTKYKIFYTPTPGGTGPILIAQIFENFYKLVERQTNR